MAGRSASDLDHIVAEEPQSIASLIEGQGDVALGAAGEEDQAALLTYLKSHYADAAGPSNPLGTGDMTVPATTYRQTPTPAPTQHFHPATEYVRAGSPLNASISIPPSLAALAAQSQFTVPSFAQPSQGNATTFDDRGEMGGKRRKLPHERAGWKEMDEEPRPKKRRGGRRSESGNEAGQVHGTNGNAFNIDIMHHPPDVGGSGVPGGSLGEVTGLVDEAKFSEAQEHGQQEQIPRPEQMSAADSKESRAAQNRRAQQVFRRKREEKMAKLEADAAGFKDAQRELVSAQFRLEAEHIENMALRMALRNISQAGTGRSILDDEGALLVQSGLQLRHGTDTPEAIDKAFKTLEMQCRELAKHNQSRKI